MAFLETPRFPEKYALTGLSGGPGWNTDVVIVNSGHESRNQNWSQARRRFDISHVPRLETDFKDLIDFFMMVKGRARGFRFKDWTDYLVTDEDEGIWVELTPTTFQMYKRYTAGAETFDRIIQKPALYTIDVIGGTLDELDYSTGIATMSAGTPTGWTGEFDVPVRFDVDEMQYDVVNRQGNQLFVHWHSIPIVEIRDIA